MNNKLIIATAGSGKTTHLVNEALKIKNEKVLITTYTRANELEIRKKIIGTKKCIPENIIIQTWFSFLLKDGVRPFQGALFEKKIKGLILVNGQSAMYSREIDIEKHYFTKDLKIFSDKLSKFVFRCNEKTNGYVIDRISRIYSHIFIDEVQDLAGYDLELLKLFFACDSNILLVGDPRQGTYSTNSASKNKQFQRTKIINFFTDKIDNLTRDDKSLTTNYRCNKSICNLSNKLYPTMQQTTSGNNKTTEHDGIFYVKERDLEDYLQQHKPMQLRYNREEKKINENYCVMNFGESKGLSFDRVLIYPTEPILNWLKNNNAKFADTSRSKFYVALTRARHSVGIVVDNDYNENQFPFWRNDVK
jgi:superfamily I DNA/RNA helicase